MSVILLPNKLRQQPQRLPQLANPELWRLVDIQGMPLLGTAATSITRTLDGTARLSTGRAGKCVDFVATGDYLDYGSTTSALQLSTMTGIAVVEIPSSASDRSTIFNTNASGAFSEGFVISVNANGTVFVLKQDVVGLGTTTKTVKLGGVSTVAWSYNNVSGLLRIAIDGVLESFVSAQNFAHNIVARNKYYLGSGVQANAHKQYLFALSAECDRITNAQLIDWSNNPWQIFKAPTRRLWAVSTAGTTHDLIGSNATQTNAASAAGISQAHALGGATSTQANAASSGAITQVHVLAASHGAQTNTSSTGAITQGGSFTAENAVQANTGSTGAITQTHALAAANAAQGNTAATGAVTQTHALTGSTSAQGNTASTGAITQGTQFVGSSATQTNTAGTGAITQAHALTGAGSTQSQAASAASIAQAHVLVGASATQANVATTGAISQGVVHDLAASQSTQANTGSAGAITQTHILVFAPSVQDNIAAASAIVQAHVLIASSATQANAASTGAIEQTSGIPPVDAPAGSGPRLRISRERRPAQLR